MGSMEKGREQDMGKEKHGGKARYNINRLRIWTDMDYTIIAHILKRWEKTVYFFLSNAYA